MKKKRKNFNFINFDYDKFLTLKHRFIFLNEEINEGSSKRIIKQLLSLNLISSKDPIIFHINSYGGSIIDTFAIIDTMVMLSNPIMTLINGIACSAAGIISISGDMRQMTKNSYWMGHDMTSGGIDYSAKLEERFKFQKSLWNRIELILRNKTKLSKNDMKLLRNKELWLDSTQCLKKGIVDRIVT